MATITIEHTDTFGGEANYCWVRRETVEEPEGKPFSKLALVRKPKSLRKCPVSAPKSPTTAIW